MTWGIWRAPIKLQIKFSVWSTFREQKWIISSNRRRETEAIAELRRLFELQTDRRDIVLDLRDVGVVDREVIRFLGDREADGVQFENSPSYICEWMEREKD